MWESDDCCKSFCKFVLACINFLFLLLGLLMLAFGIAMVVAPDKVAQSMQDTGADLKLLGDAKAIIKAAGIFMIVLGCIVALVGAFGFFGACCENKVLLIVYLIAVVIILLLEVALIIFAACYPANLKTYVQEEMNKTLINDFKEDVRVYPNVTFGSSNPFGYSWAATQFGARCCGVYGKQDYTGEYKYYSQEQRQVQLNALVTVEAKVPISCCKLKDNVKFPDDIKGQDSFENLEICLTTGFTAVNEQDCYDSVNRMIVKASRVAIGIAAAIIAFQVLIIVLGIILCCAIQ